MSPVPDKLSIWTELNDTSVLKVTVLPKLMGPIQSVPHPFSPLLSMYRPQSRACQTYIFVVVALKTRFHAAAGGSSSHPKLAESWE
jgi:hypothetical protein